jgi:predicted nucleotidyltransferase
MDRAASETSPFLQVGAGWRPDVRVRSIRADSRAAERWSSRRASVHQGRSFALLRILRNNLRVMRKPAVLAALFPTVRGDVLAATLTQPEKWWYLSELAQFLGTAPSSLQRELKALVDGGILETRREGTRAYFKADTRSAVFPELRGLINKTAGVVPTLRTSLRLFEARIASAFVYGSVARSEEHAQSDIDLLVVSDGGLADLTPVLRKAEARLGREVNVTSYSVAEFRRKAAGKDHFLTEVLRGPKQFVKGDQRDVDDLSGKPRRSTASDVETRAR